MDMGEKSLRITHLKKAFGRRVILDQGPLDLGPGVHFMIGPNGSGKTTFFKCLAGIHAYEGKLVFPGDVDPQRQPLMHRQMVGLCPAEPLYPEYLTGSELLGFYARVKGLGSEAYGKLVMALGMEGYVDQKVGTYSSGMKKKLGLALALTGYPAVVLLDEPYSALDQPSRRVVAGLIQEGLKRGNIFLIASHLADLHAAFGEGQVYLLEAGKFRALEKGEVLPWLEKLEPETPPQV